jgi:propanol-preferring alcohol dehydrogenase
MKAMVLRHPKPVHNRPLNLDEVETPEPGPGQIRIRVRTCGVCHTDLHTVEGELGDLPLPLIPGHQVVGIVDAVGGNTRGVKVGDRVGSAWLHETCGTCAFCKRGDENLCPDARFTGYHVNGGYAEYMTIGHAFAYRLPRGLDDVQAAPLLCAGIIGYRALVLSGIDPGGRLGLYGFGASAHVAIQVARHWGCEVYVFSRGEEHRALAAELGAAWTGRSSETPPQRLDASVIFAPAGSIVPQALEHLAPGGVLALAGIYMSEIPPLDYERHLYYEKTLRSVTAATREDGQELLRLAAKIPIRTTVQTYPLEEANHALCDLKDGHINGAAALTVNDTPA